ncbi:MAG: hypothetical protein L6R43_00675 [Planctomycetes bacterium]|nr:hypothetical protein [Planctomycetota bacterium]
MHAMTSSREVQLLRMSCLKSASALHSLSVGSPDQKTELVLRAAVRFESFVREGKA